MKKEVVARLNKNFEEVAHVEQNVEYWMARDIQELLEYDEWRNFLNVVEKAKVACERSGQPTRNHFGDVNKMVQLGNFWKSKAALQDFGDLERIGVEPMTSTMPLLRSTK